jgi:hypothetical protein
MSEDSAAPGAWPRQHIWFVADDRRDPVPHERVIINAQDSNWWRGAHALPSFLFAAGRRFELLPAQPGKPTREGTI